MHNRDRTDSCGCRSSNCSSKWFVDRREFTQLAGAGAISTYLGLPLIAGPFQAGSYRIPIEKKLPEAWIRSLYERGEKDVYSDAAALQRIGMPVGGLFAGTVYLSGDGRLWLWDVFNRDQEGISPRPFEGQLPNSNADSVLVRHMTRAGHNYIDPVNPYSPFLQSFRLRIAGDEVSLDATGFSNVAFDGRYPIGRVSFADVDLPVKVQLDAFSPFIPLNVDDSSLPATIMSYAVENTGNQQLDIELTGLLQNPVCSDGAAGSIGSLNNHVVRDDLLVGLACSAEGTPRKDDHRRDDILIEDFEKANYDGWIVEGEAFGGAPVIRKKVPEYQGDVGGEGNRVVNSHSTASGVTIAEKDDKTGTLTSSPFSINREFLQFYLGGGAHSGETCVNLLIDGKKVESVAGKNHNRMRRVAINVSRWEGRTAQLQIVDSRSGSWGNVGVDHIVFTDHPTIDDAFEQRCDFGTMVLAIVDPHHDDVASADEADPQSTAATCKVGQRMVGRVGRKVTIAPGESVTFNFVISWHFPNLTIRDMPGEMVGNHYASRFPSALHVARYVAKNFARLAGTTRRWVATWYDSSLPFWLLDRTMANTSTLATTTCYRFADGRFWAWEGIGCCAGTCTHVWHYAQAMGRLFPEIERDQRTRVDFGIALKPDGAIGHRAYLDRAIGPAMDGHCGRVLGVYREHQMSADGRFLEQIWPRTKQAIEWLIQRDSDDDGMIQGAQHNTLDAAWYGKIAWLTSLYLAALRAGAEMATEMGDNDFANKCRTIAERGKRSILETFNGEYFIQIEDPKHTDHIATGNGCHIDQVFGQTWAHWVGLGELFDRDKQLSALRALWKYNFVPDVGPFRDEFRRGRWYAMAGDAGLVMCTWPNDDQNTATRDHWQFGYFNECMTGFEWQAAAHMIWESHDQPDLLEKGLAISRAIHDRYSARLRNPYNEIECSDHYSRAMASYGVFQAICGFNCHGPKGELSFAPRLTPDKFKAAFVSPAAWGSFSQQLDNHLLRVEIDVYFGQLSLRSLGVRIPERLGRIRRVADAAGKELPHEQFQSEIRIQLGAPLMVKEGGQLAVLITSV